MKEIRMVDLRGQYIKIKSDIDNAIQNVIDSTAFINGSEVKEFQAKLEEYLGVRHVIPCANGTDALQVSMMALGLQPGDEVITSDFTFIATVEVIALLGLVPVLVDVKPDIFNIDPVEIEKAITPKTKAIVPVHLFGQCAGMSSILEIAKKHKLFVIEDAAQATGADYYFNNNQVKKAGTMGEIGCTSFFPSKNLGCYGDGGAILTNDDNLAEICRSVVNHGMKIRYYHDRIGVNSRLDTIQAAILKIKLNYLDEYNSARQKAASHYDKAFSNHQSIIIPFRDKHTSHIFHQYTLKLNGVNRGGLIEHLKNKGIPSMIYYPVPLHMQKAFKDNPYPAGKFPVTEKLCASVLSLPMHTELDDEQLDYITSSVLEYVT